MSRKNDPNYNKVWNELGGRCVLCAEPAVCVHEIVPKSQRPVSWMEPDNRVTLCNTHHRQVHNEGWRKWVRKLRKARKEMLDRLNTNTI